MIYDLVWSALRLTRYEDPIPLPGMAKIGLTLTASGQLTGVVNQLNCIATSILPAWDFGLAQWRLRRDGAIPRGSTGTSSWGRRPRGRWPLTLID